MKRILSLVLTLSALFLMSTPSAFAVVTQEEAVKSTENFNVFEIFSVKDEAELVEDLVDEANQLSEETGEPVSAIGALILRVINILTLLIGTFAVIMLILGGLTFATSGGDESRIDRGKAIISQTLIGLVIAFLAYFIVRAVLSFFF